MDVPNLDSLTDIGLRGGVDMRPTLLRVLTDLYTHKLAHTPEEERHYTELAMRLLDSVDAQTRASVAARLARRSANRRGPHSPSIESRGRSVSPRRG